MPELEHAEAGQLSRESPKKSLPEPLSPGSPDS